MSIGTNDNWYRFAENSFISKGLIDAQNGISGNGAGLTNVPGTETNVLAFWEGTNTQYRAIGTNIYLDAYPTSGLFYFSATHRMAVTNNNFYLQFYNTVWSNIAIFTP